MFQNVAAGVVPMSWDARATQAVKMAAIKASQLPASQLLHTNASALSLTSRTATFTLHPSYPIHFNAFTNLHDLLFGTKQYVYDSPY